MRLSTSVSPKMSEMSSTGRDSKVDMVVEDAEAGNPNLGPHYHFLPPPAPRRPQRWVSGLPPVHLLSGLSGRLARLGLSGMEVMGGASGPVKRM